MLEENEKSAVWYSGDLGMIIIIVSRLRYPVIDQSSIFRFNAAYLLDF